jgi:hypothetical protein
VQHTKYVAAAGPDALPARGRVCSTPHSASRFKLLACRGHGFIGQPELAADVVNGGLTTLHLAHVCLVLSLSHIGSVGKTEALVHSVDDGGVLGQQERRDCPGGK